MTGEPATGAQGVVVRTAPWWAELFGRLGADLIWPPATGYLPMSRASSRRMKLGLWYWLAFVPVAFALFLPSVFSPGPWSAAKTGLFATGLGAFLVGLIGLLRERRWRPLGRIVRRNHEKSVELHHLHAAFVAAARESRHIPDYSTAK